MTDLYPDGEYVFDIHGGEFTDERGKVHWPALLRLYIPRTQVIEVVIALLKQAGPDPLRGGDVLLSLSGSIEKKTNED